MKRKRFFRGMSAFLAFVLLFSQMAFAVPTEKTIGRKVLRVEDSSVPILTAPYAGSVVGGRPTFAWGTIGDKSNLKLQIAEDAGFTVGLREVDFATANVVTVSSTRYTYTIPGSDPELDGGKTYFWKMAFKDSLGTYNWSGPNMVKVSQSLAAQPTDNLIATPVSNVVASPGKDKVALNWDAVPGATGYYVLADGTEAFTSTNSYTQTGLTVGTSHKYSVRAVNAATAGLWSAEVSATTKEDPQISIDTSSVIEAAENGKVIRVNLTNGTFRSDGAYNTSTVIVNPADLPSGVTVGAVSYDSGNQVKITLSGNRIASADYDTDKTIRVTVSKDLLSPASALDLSGTGTLKATIEGPSAPSVNFSFSGTDAGKLVGSDPTMEYSLDGGNTYFAIGYPNMPIATKDITDTNDIRVRKQAAGGVPAGDAKLIDVLPGPGEPSVLRNGSTYSVTGLTTLMEYSTDGGNIWTAYNNTQPVLTGNVTFKVRVKGNVLTAPGKIRTIVFTLPVPVAPNVTFSFSGNDAGKLMGSTTLMEYSLDGGSAYLSIPSNNYLLNARNILPDKDIRVRMKATSTNAEGAITFLDILSGPTAEPAVKGNDILNTVEGMTTTMEFSTNGVTWTAYTASNNLPNLTGTLILMIRVKADGLKMAGPIKNLAFTGVAAVGPIIGGGAPAAVVTTFPELPSVTGQNAISTATAQKIADTLGQMKTALLKSDSVTPEKNMENIGKATSSVKDLAAILSKTNEKSVNQSLATETSTLIGTILSSISRLDGEENLKKGTEIISVLTGNTQAVLGALQEDTQKQAIEEQYLEILRASNQLINRMSTGESATLLAKNLIGGSEAFLGINKDPNLALNIQYELKAIVKSSIKKAGTQNATPNIENGVAIVTINPAAAQVLADRMENMLSAKKAMAEKLISDTNEADAKIKINIIGGVDTKNVKVVFPADIMNTMKTKKVNGVEFVSGIATVSMPSSAMSTKNVVNLSLGMKQLDPLKDLTAAQKTVVGTNPVYDFSMACAGKDGKMKVVSAFSETLDITIPYAVASGQDASKLTVFFINDKGVLENKAGLYDPVTQTISFSTDHFSKYFIKENKMTFTDLKGREADQLFIEAMAAKGMMLPAKGTQFNPSGALTKGELAKILTSTSTLSKLADKTIDAKLKDVKKSDPNYKYYFSALKQGILTSDKAGLFKADTKLTREEFAVIMGKWAQKNKGWSVTQKEIDGMSYADKGTMKAESLEGIALLTKYFVMIAKKGSDYKPTELVDRGEVAKVLYRLLFTK